VLTKNVTVMLLIVLAEAALRWNFVFWSYFVVIFWVGVDVLYYKSHPYVRYLTWPLTIHNTVYWSVRHTQSFRCLLIYPIKWDTLTVFIPPHLWIYINTMLVFPSAFVVFVCCFCNLMISGESEAYP
jgi:hypothetical protein